MFFALAVAAPVALLVVHRGLGHEGDIAFFYEWYLAFREGPAFYRDGPGLNYPIAGVLVVCGPAWVLDAIAGGTLSPHAFRIVLKGTLVLGEIALVLAAAALARELGVRRPRLVALGLYALPSTWIGGAWFGQTDVVGSALLLASAAALVRFRKNGSGLHLALGVAALHAALLSKQLTWFAAPALGMLAVAGLARHGTRARWALALLSPLVWLAADPFLVLPDGYRSHLWFVLAGGGSSHGELVVASGASVWALVARGGTLAREVTVLGVSSFAVGWIAWGASQAAAIAGVVRARLSTHALVWLAGVSHLAMATLLTGVHERYLAHAIPLLVLANAGAPMWRGALGYAIGTVSGVFVLSTLSPGLFGGPLALLGRPEPLAVLCIAWLLTELVASLVTRWPAHDGPCADESRSLSAPPSSR
jgi:hypothetical protein